MRGALGAGAGLGIAWVACLTACSKPAVTANAPASPSRPPLPLPAPAPLPPPPFDTLPSLDALRRRAPVVAPGMREVGSGEISNLSPSPTNAPVLVRADDGDTCLRVVLAGEPGLHAWLTGGRENILSDISFTTATTLAPRGPVCVRKGDAVTLHVAGEGSWAARFVAWASSPSPPASQ